MSINCLEWETISNHHCTPWQWVCLFMGRNQGGRRLRFSNTLLPKNQIKKTLTHIYEQNKVYGKYLMAKAGLLVIFFLIMKKSLATSALLAS